MAYTTGRTWVDQEVVTEGNFNEQLRDNMLFISTHGHSGAEGDGSTTLGSLVKVTLTDASAPAAPGAGKTVFYTVSGRPFYRAGAAGASTQLADANDLHAQDHASRHEPSGGDAMAVDAAAGTPSLRSLGSTSTKAAAGNHTHPLAAPNVDELNNDKSLDTNVETVVNTTTFTPQEAGLSIAMVASFFLRDGASNVYTIRLKHGSTTIDSATGLTVSTNVLHILQGLQVSAAQSSTVYTTTIQRTSGGTAFNTRATLVTREITKNT